MLATDKVLPPAPRPALGSFPPKPLEGPPAPGPPAPLPRPDPGPPAPKGNKGISGKLDG